MKLIKLLTNNSKIIKFLIVGSASTIIDVVFLYIFVDILLIPLFIGIILSFLLAVINGFTWNKFWTFRNKSIKYKRQFIKFLFVSIIGLILTLILMYILTIAIGIYYIISKLLTSLIIVIWNFLGNKYWTFKIKNKSNFNKIKFDLFLSIIVPAYNEEKRLPSTLKKIYQYLKKKNFNYEIIVVDDGSYDNTVYLIKKLNIDKLKIIKNGKNKGKGFSVKKGVLNANGKYILFTDADNSTPIEELDNLLKYIKNYDIVIGSRYCNNSKIKIKQTKLRNKIGRIGNKIIKYFLFDGIEDTQCGFKLFKHNIAKNLFILQKINGFGFDMEILLAGKSIGYSIKEVPVNWYNSDFSRVRPIRDSLKTLLELIFIKINYWFDGYKK